MNTISTETYLPSSIYLDCLKHFNEVRDLDFVVSKSIPIPFFGDIKKYLNSPVKVVTAALNPSDIEFSEAEARFNVDKGLQGPNALESELSNYFKGAPYKKWFNSFEPFLNGLGTSYGGKMNSQSFSSTSLHIDFCSPIATRPTWSKLKTKQKEQLQHIGHQIFDQLLIALKPDLVVASLSWNHIVGRSPDFKQGRDWPIFISHQKKENGEPYKRLPILQVNSITDKGNRPFLFAMASAGFTPFFGFTKQRRIEAGQQLAIDILRKPNAFL